MVNESRDIHHLISHDVVGIFAHFLFFSFLLLLFKFMGIYIYICMYVSLVIVPLELRSINHRGVSIEIVRRKLYIRVCSLLIINFVCN